MRFDLFRRRTAHPSPSSLPATPFRPVSQSPPTSRWASSDRQRSVADSSSTAIKPAPLQLPASSRSEYIRALEARMEQMEKIPTSSFYHSYAGEFDMLLGEDRKASRKMHEFETSTRAENAYRNRYANILSNEPTRVRLQAVNPGENDYINANLVSGHDGHPGYIATQAPLPDTTPHFWQMVYESKTPVIIMLTREYEDNCHVTKSERYWPPIGQNVLFNDYLVHGIDENVDTSRGLIERRFQVGRVVDKRRKHARDLVDADSLVAPTNDNQAWQTPSRSRSQPNCIDDDCDGDVEDLMKNLELLGPVRDVYQMQYIDWPDQDVPTTPCTLLDLCRRVDALFYSECSKTNKFGPPIVHCSAGVGRTGTFIAIDQTLRRLSDAFVGPDGKSQMPVHVDEIRELVRKMKRERSKMVQTAEQYRFIYLAVLEGLKRWESGQPIFISRVESLTNGYSSRDSPSPETESNG